MQRICIGGSGAQSVAFSVQHWYAGALIITNYAYAKLVQMASLTNSYFDDVIVFNV